MNSSTMAPPRGRVKAAQSPPPTQRYAMQLDETAIKHLERLQSAYRLKSKADVYELAVRMLTWMTDQQAAGLEVGRYKDGQFQPLLTPHDFNTQVWQEGR